MKNQVVAMVPVRAGSIRVKDKNTRPFAGTSLLELKLSLLKRLNGLDKIVVSTNCSLAAKLAQIAGVELQWRDDYYASSTITNDLHWQHIAEKTPGNTLFLAQVTSPMLKVSTMQAALDLFLKLKGHDSINSVSPEKKFLWNDGAPINYNVDLTPKSQDLPDIVSLNFAITVISRSLMMSRKNVVGNSPKFYELNKIEALDVDDIFDFNFAELVFQKYGYNWLIN